MSRRNKQTQQPKKRSLVRYMWQGGLGIILAVGISGLILFWPDNPQRLYREAQAALDSDPALSSELAQLAVVAADGDFPDAHLLWCRALARQDERLNAIGCFRLLPDPDRCDVVALLATAQEAAESDQPVLQTLALEAANRPGPHQQEVLRRLASLKVSQGELDAALMLCETWQKVEPGSPDPLWGQLEIHQRSGTFIKAADVARQLREMPISDSEKRRLRKTLLGLLVEVGDIEGARAELDAALVQDQYEPEIRLRKSQLLRLEGSADAALAEIESLIADGFTSTRALMVRGVLYLDGGKFELARRDFEEVIRQQPENKQAHYKLSQTYRRLGQDESASKHLAISQKLTDDAIRAMNQNESRPEPDTK